MDMLLKVKLKKCMMAKVATTEIGMAKALISVIVRLLRKIKTAKVAKNPP